MIFKAAKVPQCSRCSKWFRTASVYYRLLCKCG